MMITAVLHRPARFFAITAFAVIALFVPHAGYAALTLVVVGAGANQIPIAIAPFRAEEGTPQPLTPVIAADLARSGLFKNVDAGGIVPVPTEPEQVNFAQWKAR